MQTILLAIIMSALAAGGMSLAHHDQHGKGGVQVKLLYQKDIVEKLDGKKAKATMLEVTLAPGEVEAAHRHPGPAFGYILEGEYEWAIDDNKPKIFKAGDTFYEPTGCLHGIGRNPSTKDKTRFIAVVLHPEDAKDLVIPERDKK
jgi:quercetin dioxygenase-like cupin family protein